MFYFPLSHLFILFGLILLGLLIFLIEVKAITYAYEKAGINHRYVFAVLLASLVGSVVNIPLARLGGGEVVVGGHLVRYHGMDYFIPAIGRTAGTLLAVNVGGALVPTLVSVYLLWRMPRLLPKAAVGVAAVSLAIYALAEPVHGVGIAVPTFIPPVLAALVALVLDRQSAPPLAYVSGTLGVLIGADLMNLGAVASLGAPVASIGGAGTFDGVFLTGIVAVLLA